MSAGADKQKNLFCAEKLIKKAASAGAKFICLPEMFCFRSKRILKELKENVAEDLNGEIVKRMSFLSKTYGITISAGSFHEKVSGKQKLFNTSICFNPQGKKIAIYRKMNLFEAIIHSRRICESKHFYPGKKRATATVGSFKVGFSICYDLRFPSLYEGYKKQGVEVLCVPSAFTKKTGQAHWEVLVRARAIENRCYVLASNQIGSDGTVVEAYGHSMIVNPWGEIVAQSKSKKEEILYASIKKETIKKVKEALPL